MNYENETLDKHKLTVLYKDCLEEIINTNGRLIYDIMLVLLRIRLGEDCALKSLIDYIPDRLMFSYSPVNKCNVVCEGEKPGVSYSTLIQDPYNSALYGKSLYLGPVLAVYQRLTMKRLRLCLSYMFRGSRRIYQLNHADEFKLARRLPIEYDDYDLELFNWGANLRVWYKDRPRCKNREKLIELFKSSLKMLGFAVDEFRRCQFSITDPNIRLDRKKLVELYLHTPLCISTPRLVREAEKNVVYERYIQGIYSCSNGELGTEFGSTISLVV